MPPLYWAIRLGDVNQPVQEAISDIIATTFSSSGGPSEGEAKCPEFHVFKMSAQEPVEAKKASPRDPPLSARKTAGTKKPRTSQKTSKQDSSGLCIVTPSIDFDVVEWRRWAAALMAQNQQIEHLRNIIQQLVPERQTQMAESSREFTTPQDDRKLASFRQRQTETSEMSEFGKPSPPPSGDLTARRREVTRVLPVPLLALDGLKRSGTPELLSPERYQALLSSSRPAPKLTTSDSQLGACSSRRVPISARTIRIEPIQNFNPCMPPSPMSVPIQSQTISTASPSFPATASVVAPRSWTTQGVTEGRHEQVSLEFKRMYFSPSGGIAGQQYIVSRRCSQTHSDSAAVQHGNRNKQTIPSRTSEIDGSQINAVERRGSLFVNSAVLKDNGRPISHLYRTHSPPRVEPPLRDTWVPYQLRNLRSTSPLPPFPNSCSPLMDNPPGFTRARSPSKGNHHANISHLRLGLRPIALGSTPPPSTRPPPVLSPVPTKQLLTQADRSVMVSENTRTETEESMPVISQGRKNSIFSNLEARNRLLMGVVPPTSHPAKLAPSEKKRALSLEGMSVCPSHGSFKAKGESDRRLFEPQVTSSLLSRIGSWIDRQRYVTSPPSFLEDQLASSTGITADMKSKKEDRKHPLENHSRGNALKKSTLSSDKTFLDASEDKIVFRKELQDLRTRTATVEETRRKHKQPLDPRSSNSTDNLHFISPRVDPLSKDISRATHRRTSKALRVVEKTNSEGACRHVTQAPSWALGGNSESPLDPSQRGKVIQNVFQVGSQLLEPVFYGVAPNRREKLAKSRNGAMKPKHEQFESTGLRAKQGKVKTVV